MTARGTPVLRAPPDAPLSLPVDTPEQDRESDDQAMVEQSDDDSPRNPARRGSVPVSER